MPQSVDCSPALFDSRLISRDSFPVAVGGFVRADDPNDATYGILAGYQKGETRCHVYVYDPTEFGLRGTSEEILRAEANTLKSVLPGPEARAVCPSGMPLQLRLMDRL